MHAHDGIGSQLKAHLRPTKLGALVTHTTHNSMVPVDLDTALYSSSVTGYRYRIIMTTLISFFFSNNSPARWEKSVEIYYLSQHLLETICVCSMLFEPQNSLRLTVVYYRPLSTKDVHIQNVYTALHSSGSSHRYNLAFVSWYDALN